jgi:hypothetical protein
MPGMKGTMHEWKAGTLHSGSKTGPVVKSQKQAIAIGLSQARKAGAKIPKPRGGGNPSGKPTRSTGPKLFQPKVKQPKPSGLY